MGSRNSSRDSRSAWPKAPCWKTLAPGSSTWLVHGPVSAPSVCPSGSRSTASRVSARPLPGSLPVPGQSVLRAVASQHLTGVHRGNTITALPFVHKVGGDEDVTPCPGRAASAMPRNDYGRPGLPRTWVRQDQQLRVHHRHRKGQPLAHPEGQLRPGGPVHPPARSRH